MKTEVILMILFDGTILMNPGLVLSRLRMQDANFVVIKQDGKLYVHKERYLHELRDQKLTYKQVFEHALRHLAEVEKTKKAAS